VQQPGSLLARDSYTSFSITSLVSQLGSTGASPLKRSARSPSLVHRPGWDTHPGNWSNPPKERNRFLCRSKGSYSDRKRALKWVRPTHFVLASLRPDQRKYYVLVLRTHPVGAVV